MKLKNPEAKFGWRQALRLGAGLVVVLILVKVLLLGQALFAVKQDYDALQAFVKMPAGEMMQTARIAQLEGNLVQSESDLQSLKRESAGLFPLAPYLGWIPFVGGDIEQSPAVLDYATEAIGTGRMALDLYRVVLRKMPAGGDLKSPARGALLIQTMDALRPDVDRMKRQLADLRAARDRIDEARLGSVTARLVQRGDSILKLAVPAIEMFDSLPDLLGARGTRRYLFIAQNNDELRATGGFISGAGVIEVENGKIVKMDFRDSYALDDLSKKHPAPPGALTTYMDAGIWVFRDGNWSPDFPTTARTLEQLYQLDQGVAVDGVIAVNVGAAVRLTEALAPIDLPTYGERIDASNVLERIEYYFASPEGLGQSGDWWSHRKDFMAALLQAMIERLNAGDSVQATRLAQAMLANLTAKDILIYLNEPSVARTLHELRWDGALPEIHGDALMVVDSNVGFNKVDRLIERRFDYRVELRPGDRARASVRLEYHNQNPATNEACVHAPAYKATYAEMRNSCYWNYVRVYVPEGSIPITATEGIAPAVEVPEAGYAVLGGFLVLPRGETRAVRFDYRLPAGIVRSDGSSEYTLNWIKQPGAPAAMVRVVVVIPASLQIVETDPPPSARANSGIEFILASDRDGTIKVRLAPAWNLSYLVGWVLLGFTFLALVLIVRQWRAGRAKIEARPS
ncbi:MAG: DUF4012 domain-containing protein [Chloroflexi bacterium]|nr:DUF4012 domain-containing protein [Chloroflexota bacterium]